MDLAVRKSEKQAVAAIPEGPGEVASLRMRRWRAGVFFQELQNMVVGGEERLQRQEIFPRRLPYKIFDFAQALLVGLRENDFDGHLLFESLEARLFARVLESPAAGKVVHGEEAALEGRDFVLQLGVLVLVHQNIVLPGAALDTNGFAGGQVEVVLELSAEFFGAGTFHGDHLFR